jgi:uncharacterized low-complexity protein
MKLSNKTPIALAVGSTLVSGLTSTAIQADTLSGLDANPFIINELSAGYMQTAEAGTEGGSEESTKMKNGSCGEGKCGGAMAQGSEEKTTEGACAGNKPMPKSTEKNKEAKCGEGKCGGSM